MKTEAAGGPFRVMEWLRGTRAWIHEETKGMTPEEERRWSEELIRSDSFLAKLYDCRKPPEALMRASRGTGARHRGADA